MDSRKSDLMVRIESSRGVERPATLHWHDFDPFAVVIVVSVGNMEVRTWEFSLDLISDALDSPGRGFGEGDVVSRVVRVPADQSEWRIHLSLSSPDGSGEVSFLAALAREFVSSIPETDTDCTVSDHLDRLLEELRGEVEQ